MLVLTRRLNDRIVFPGLGIAIQVVAVQGGAVRLGIEAPPGVLVLREELLQEGPERLQAGSNRTSPTHA